MPKSSTGNADWERHKDIIYELYVKHDQKLKDVISLMTERHGYTRSKAQYERMFRKWNWKKNLTANEWKIVAHKTRMRRGEVEVRVHGILIPSQKVKKETQRHGYQTTLQLCQAAYCEPENPRTPPGVMITWPPPSPSQMVLSTSGTRRFSERTIFRCASATPWLSVLNLMEYLRQSSLGTLLHIPEQSSSLATSTWIRAENLNGTIGSEHDPVELIPRTTMTYFQSFVDDLTASLSASEFLNFETVETGIAKMTKSSFLPPTGSAESNVDVTAVLNLKDRSSQLEFLKLAISLASNNRHTPELMLALVDLCDDSRNLDLLQELLRRQLPSIDALAEKLLVPATHAGNRRLVAFLVEHGVDVDAKGQLFDYFDVMESSPLACAIKTRDAAMVRYLLGHGADPNIPYTNHGIYRSFLDFAAANASVEIIEEVLRPRPQLEHASPIITTHTIYRAIIGDDERSRSVLSMLLQRTNISEIDQKSQLRIMDRAALFGSIKIVEELRRWSFDINATDTSGRGSVLATAIYEHHIKLALYLIHNGANINTVGLERSGMTPLQASLYTNDLGTTETLLRLGANPDLVGICKVAPIEIAAYQCGLHTVLRLLDRGANLNPPVRRWDEFSVLDHLKGKTALQISIEVGSLEISEILFERGAKFPSPEDNESWDPLVSAFTGGNWKLVHFVLEKTNIIPDTYKYLQACIELGRSDLARTLIDESVFHLTKDNLHPGVIFAAVFQDDTDFAEYILDKTREIFGVISEERGVAALVAAVHRKNIRLMRMLLDTGVKPCIRYQHIESVGSQHTLLSRVDGMPNAWHSIGMTAFDAIFPDDQSFNDATCLENIEDVRSSTSLLVEACRSHHSSNGEHVCQRAMETAFLEAHRGYVYDETRLALIQLFVNAGVDINCRSKTIGTPGGLQLALSATSGSRYANRYSFKITWIAIFEYLVQAGANVNCKAIYNSYTGQTHNTPLQYASNYNEVHLVRLFLEHGADVNAKPASKNGATALQFAAIRGNFEILNILLEAGADINASRSRWDGRTTIEGAAEWGRLDMVRYLLEAGAGVKGRENRQYRRAVYRAWKGSHRALAKMIQDYKVEKYGADDVCSIEEILDSVTEDELEHEL